VKVLFIDHRDSFSGNLIAALKVAGACLDVVQYSDLPEAADALLCLSQNYDALVLSPGPGTPAEYPRSFALYKIGFCEKPALGVCLGLQIVLSGEGFCVERICENPVHGRQSELDMFSSPGNFDLSGLWVFYNSLGVRSVAPRLEVAGWRVLAQESGFVAAARHAAKKHLLVQFHPESFASANGERLIRDFVRW
jgi:anthranilate/para-aminobenzoate synthase component II